MLIFKKFKFILLFSGILLNTFFAQAINPCKIEGIVNDGETFKPIPSANIELLQFTDSIKVNATVTDLQGLFKFDDVPFGKYLIRISYLGYRKVYIPVFELIPGKPTIKFGTTNLFTESKTLNEVSIVGQKLTGQIEGDKTIYQIQGKVADIAQSGVELLRQLPDFTVSYMSNDVKMAGSSNLLYQVNGKKVDVNYLTQLNPKMVEKIEVITNPGVKYDSEVDAVINIILRTDMQYGISGRLRIDIPNGKLLLLRNNGSLDFFYKKIRIYAGGNFRVSRFDLHSNEERWGSSSYLSRNSSSDYLEKKGGLSYGLDWFINDKNSFNFYSSLQPRIKNSNDFNMNILTVSGTDSVFSIGNINSASQNFYNDYSLFYKHKFDKKDHELTAELGGGHKDNKSNSLYNQWTEDILTYSLDKLSDTKSSQLTIKIDYTYPITSHFNLSAGYNGVFTNSEYIYNEKVSSVNDDLKYYEKRHNSYSNLAWNKDNLTLQGGIRMERTHFELKHDNDTTNSYYTWLPFLSVQYKIGKKHNFRLNYRQSVSRPGVSQLSPMVYSDDNYSQTIGNPDLKPSYNNKIEFTHRYQIFGPNNISYRPYVNFIRDGIRQITLVSSDSIQRKQYCNVSNDFEYGVTVSGTVSFAKWWNISPSYTYFNRTMKALPEYGITSDQSRTSWRFNVSSQITLPKEWILFVEYYYNSPVLSYQTTSQQNYEFVTGFYKAINKKVNFTLVVLNPWSQRYISNKSETRTSSTLSKTNEYIDYSYIVFLRFGFNFNYGKEGKKLNRQVESDDAGDKKGIF
jgi:hypothetical protein